MVLSSKRTKILIKSELKQYTITSLRYVIDTKYCLALDVVNDNVFHFAILTSDYMSSTEYSAGFSILPKLMRVPYQ